MILHHFIAKWRAAHGQVLGAVHIEDEAAGEVFAQRIVG
jgi:hypothetical protein